MLGDMDKLRAQFFSSAYSDYVLKQEAAADEHVHRARMLDHSAAVLIAGHAGMPNINAVWVDCNPQRSWLDKNDERKLMNMAYEHVNKNAEWLERFTSVGGNPGNQPFALENTDMARAFVQTMQLYHAKFKQVVCLSPATEAAMQEIVMTILDNVVVITTQITQNTHAEDDGDDCKHLCMLLRRLPLTRGQFCKVVGRVLGYRNALQQGTAITARRLYQLEVEMRRSIMLWETWLQTNLRGVAALVKKHDRGKIDEITGGKIDHFNYDWVYPALHRLNLIQQEMEQKDEITEEERKKRKNDGGGEKSPSRKRGAAGSGSLYTLVRPL